MHRIFIFVCLATHLLFIMVTGAIAGSPLPETYPGYGRVQKILTDLGQAVPGGLPRFRPNILDTYDNSAFVDEEYIIVSHPDFATRIDHGWRVLVRLQAAGPTKRVVIPGYSPVR